MNANELRIGNYYDHNGEIKTVTPNTILEVWEAKRNWCKAISLTEEWLLKFGFKEIIVDSWYSKLAENKNTINISKSGLVAINDDKPIRAIEYVNQLQNIYFALTGEELTIKEQ